MELLLQETIFLYIKEGLDQCTFSHNYAPYLIHNYTTIFINYSKNNLRRWKYFQKTCPAFSEIGQLTRGCGNGHYPRPNSTDQKSPESLNCKR